jgi:hypothetical protein
MEKFPNKNEKVTVIEGRKFPQEEIEALKNIRSYADKISTEIDDMSEEEYDAIKLPENYHAKIKELFQEKIANKPDIGEDAKFSVMRNAEYVVCKNYIDFKNSQFDRLESYIEEMNIWRAKFSSSVKILPDTHHHENFQDFQEDLSREYNQKSKTYGFAGQGEDSIYFLSESGISLRMKKANLLRGSFANVLQPPMDLVLFTDNFGREFMDKVKNPFPKDKTSFEPQLGYQVYEFGTSDIQEGSIKEDSSRVRVVDDKGFLCVENTKSDHMGHYINHIDWSH